MTHPKWCIVQLYHPERIREKICAEYDGTNVRELARKYDYSEKSIRRIIREQKNREEN